MERYLHPKERVYQLQNQSSKPKKFHFVNISAPDRGSYDRSVRSFVLTGHVYARKRRSDKRKYQRVIAAEGTASRETLSSNRRLETHGRTKCTVRSIEHTEWLREQFSQRGTPMSKFQQGPGDPFQCFGRSINALEMQLIQERTRNFLCPQT